MNFGLFSMFTTRSGQPQAETFKEGFGLIKGAEEVGMDTIWLGEIHFRPDRSVLSSPMAVASAVAMVTSRVRVGLAVQVLPLANPVRVAEEAATLDHLSGGRFDFGVGRSSFIEAYQGYSMDYGESRGRFSEALEIIFKAWEEKPFSYEGEFYAYHNVNVVPKPVQKPRPPVRIAVESVESFPMAGRTGMPIFIRFQMSIPQLQDCLHVYQEARQQAGFDGPNDVILQVPAYVATTAQRAYDEPRESTMYQRRLLFQQLQRSSGDAGTLARLQATYNDSYDDALPRMLYGTPEAVTDKLLELKEELNLTGVSLDMNYGGLIPNDRVVNSMRLLMEKVAPNFK